MSQFLRSKGPFNLAVFIVMCFGSLLIFAAAGAAPFAGGITGKVVDKKTGDALPGANVIVVGTASGVNIAATSL